MSKFSSLDNTKLAILQDANRKLHISDDLSLERNKNIIFIYCPPKVGSTTLVTSLRLFAIHKYTIVHIHDEAMLKRLGNITNVTVNEIISYNSSLGKKVYVIDIYRTPIERKISVFFEKIATHHFNNTEIKINNYNVNKLIHRFNKVFPHIATSDYYLDHNRYNMPLLETADFSKKIILQEVDNIKYVKLRLKDADSWPAALTKILDTPVYIVKDYDTASKPLKDIYIMFLHQYKIPENYFSLIEACDKLQYYYSDEEREQYLNQWRNRKTADFTPYTDDEYIFYDKLCVENQHINDVQVNHYIDNGCICVACSSRRKRMTTRIMNGEKIMGKIIHDDEVVAYAKRKPNKSKQPNRPK